MKLEVTGKREDRKFVTLDCVVINQHGKTVASGTAEVMPPAEKAVIERPPMPRVHVEV